jgi:hypothetical protein
MDTIKNNRQFSCGNSEFHNQSLFKIGFHFISFSLIQETRVNPPSTYNVVPVI